MQNNPFTGQSVHIVGIKGSGCAALAELLAQSGAIVTGSDGPARFYTDALLKRAGIVWHEEFNAANIAAGTQIVVHSAAYGPDNPEIAAAQKRNLTILSYPQALGLLSRQTLAAAIAGVHGKTSSTGLCGVIARAFGLKASVLAGSAVTDFGGSSVLYGGDDFFIAETCEYRRHFLNFSPDIILLTAIEHDHQDYFKSPADIENAFLEFCSKLPAGGRLVYCADDAGAKAAAARMAASRPDIQQIPYGQSASGPFQICAADASKGGLSFQLAGIKQTFSLSVPGFHNILNAAGSLAAMRVLAEAGGIQITQESFQKAAEALKTFKGSSRRAETIGTARGILIMDDYAHHPTAIASTIAGLKAFYPERRLTVSFMSHTYSRTAPLLEAFAASLDGADRVVLHKIYASARERYDGTVTGRTLFEACKERGQQAFYFEEPLDALDFCKQNLKTGDLFVTMGAGDNFQLSRKLFEELSCVV